jgi:hypothetical protein
VVKGKEKYCKAKYRPAGKLLNVNAMSYFKLKLQLKFGNNKNDSSIITNFHRFSR